MAHPDPDQLIGRLARARLGRAPAHAAEVCPDAEMLAAYADGGLPADETARVDAHLAGCAACRRLVAVLMPERAAGVAAETVTAGAVILPFRQRRVVVWLSAAAGLLAAVTLWSVSRLSEPTGITHMASAPAERALQAPPPPPVAMTPLAEPPSATAAGSAPPAAAFRTDALKAAAPAPAERARQRVAGAPDTVESARRDRRATAQAAGDDEAKKLADAAAAASLAERMAQATNQRPIASQTNTVVAGVDRARGPLSQQAANAAQNAQQVASAPPPAAAPAPAQPRAARAPAPTSAPSPSPPAPARDRPAEAEARAEPTVRTGGAAAGRENAPADSRLAKAEPVLGFARAREADAAAGARAAFSSAGAPPALLFAEPDGRLQWRIANGRRLESSSDGGTSWAPKHTAQARLHAGSAPSIDAAWAVGDGGLVLRFTVPGGWAAVNRPADVALVAVSATSGTTARVTAADGRVFETTDGGQSWTTAASGAAPR